MRPSLFLLLALACAAPAQDPLARARESTDRALKFLFLQGAGPMAASPTPVFHAGRYLVAAARCHRAYDLSDGPVMRPFYELVIKNRRPDGSFHGPEEAEPVRSTLWAIEALAALDPEAFRHEIQMAGDRVRAAATPEDAGSPFEAMVREASGRLAGLSEAEAKARLAELVGELAGGQTAGGAWSGPGGIDLERTLDRLVRLVALQQVGKRERAGGQSPSLPDFAEKGVDFLLSRAPEGTWKLAGAPHPGITAMCLTGVLMRPEARRSARDREIIDRGLRYLLSCQGEDGAFAASGTPVYVTSAALQALLAANRPELLPAVQRGMRYLLLMQNVEARGYNAGDRDFGSIGYGSSNRGDLSNLQMALDAARSAGLPQEDEALARALVFLERTQNLAAHNSFQGKALIDGERVPVRAGNDGGSAYYPGNSNAGYIKLADGTHIPRSYGSMTWALLKSYILCGLDRQDERVQAAWKWLQENYTLEENPGFSEELKREGKHYQGLFYYYATLARTLELMGVDAIPVPSKQPDSKEIAWTPRPWRAELLAKLAASQKPDGSWVNDKESRWMEGNPDLATAYALIAASHAARMPQVPRPR